MGNVNNSNGIRSRSLGRHLVKRVAGIAVPLSAMLAQGCMQAGGDVPSTDDPPTSDKVTGAVGGSATFGTSLASVVVAGCSGTVIGPRHILGAAHCVGRFASGFPVNISMNGVSQSTTVVNAYTNYDFTDATVMITHDLLAVEPVRVLPSEPMDNWTGRRLLHVGYSTGAQNAGYETIQGFEPNGALFDVGGGSDNSGGCQGDSGGPVFAFLRGRPYLVGNDGGQSGCPSTNAFGRADRYANWLRSFVPLHGSHIHSNRGAVDPSVSPGDVDNDGKMDFIVSTNTGTRLRRSTGTGFLDWSFPTTNAITSADLQMGNIETLLADVDGDGYDDLLMLTTHGFYVFRSNGATFDINNTPYYVNPGWQIGLAHIAAARFLGSNQRSSLFVSDVNSSWLYDLLTPTPTISAIGAQFQYPIHRVTPTVADFDGDGLADVILQDASGAVLYTGGNSGGYPTLTAQNCTGSSLPGLSRGAFSLTPGNFLPGVASELLAIGSSGTTAYRRTGTSCLSSYWTTTWKANDTQFIVSNFNGDAYDDVLIQNAAGANLYTSTGNTTTPWNANVWVRGDLPLHVAQFTAGSWSGDTISDLWITTPGGSFGYKGAANGAFVNDIWVDATLKLETFTLQ